MFHSRLHPLLAFLVGWTDRVRTLGCGLEWLTQLLDAVGWASKCPPAVVPTMTFFSTLGDLDLRGVLWDDFTSLPSLPSWKVPFFSREWYQGNHPSIHSFNWSPCHYPGIGCQHSWVSSSWLQFLPTWRWWILPPGLGRKCSICQSQGMRKWSGLIASHRAG